MTLDSRYTGGWSTAQHDCLLCEMEKRTEWHLETPRLVIADTLSGGPFVVWKTHKTELTEQERNVVERCVSLLYEDFEIDVRMGMVPDHWHGHIVPTDKNVDLSNE